MTGRRVSNTINLFPLPISFCWLAKNTYHEMPLVIESPRFVAREIVSWKSRFMNCGLNWWMNLWWSDYFLGIVSARHSWRNGGFRNSLKFADKYFASKREWFSFANTRRVFSRRRTFTFVEGRIVFL